MPVAPSSDPEKTSRSAGSAAEVVVRDYSEIKHFSFDIGGNWDDKNVCIFIRSYRETVEEFEDFSKKNIDFWNQVAERGIGLGGNKECFITGNYCMELAERLKAFVLKYENELQSVERFIELKNDVSDLLPYFPPPDYEMIGLKKKSSTTLVNSDMDKVDLVLNVCDEHFHRFGRAGHTYASIWSQISKEVSKCAGTTIDAKRVLEELKRSVIKKLNNISDPLERAREFSKIYPKFTNVYFDYVEPRDIKKKDYVFEELGVINNASEMMQRKIALKAIEASSLSLVTDKTELSGDGNTGEESDPSHSGDPMDQSDLSSVDASSSGQDVVIRRRPGRPKGPVRKKPLPRGFSPIQTRSSGRNRVNSDFDGQLRAQPVVSLVRVSMENSDKMDSPRSDLSRKYGQMDSQRNDRFSRKYAQSPMESVVKRRKRSAGMAQREGFCPSRHGYTASFDRTRPGTNGALGGRRKPRSGNNSSEGVLRSPFGSSSRLQTDAAGEAAVVPAHDARTYNSTYSSSSASARLNNYAHDQTRESRGLSPCHRNVVARTRQRFDYGEGLQPSVYRGDRDEYSRSSNSKMDLMCRYENMERNKMAFLRKMHAEVLVEMRRANDVLEELASKSIFSR